MQVKDRKENYFNIILQIPLILYILCLFFLFVLGVRSINFIGVCLNVCILFINGFGLSKNNKKWNIIATISIAIFILIYAIMGYYDYIRWTSTIIATILLIFYGIIFFLKKKIIKH